MIDIASAGRRSRHQEWAEQLRTLDGHQERKFRPDEADRADWADWADRTCGGRGGWMMLRGLFFGISGMARGELIHEQLTHSVIGAFFDVYNALGFGFLESVYTAALERELRDRGHKVGREVFAPVFYRAEIIARQRLDMVVDSKLVIEVKSTYEVNAAAPRQVYSYLHGTGLQLGLLLHFGPRPKFYRIFSSTPSTSSPKMLYPPNPPNPSHPVEPSVLGASRADRVDRAATDGGSAHADHPDDADTDGTGSP
jgi:GxxExxY protein